MGDDLSEVGTSLDVLQREHDRVLENIGLLRAASLCLKLGALAPDSPIWEKGIDHLSKILDFFDKDVRLHFLREEKALFPSLERHLGVEKSPTRLLLKEHSEVWEWHDRLEKMLMELQGKGSKPSEVIQSQIQEISSHMEHLLREHIKKENESLLPLAKSLLSGEELEEISAEWKSLDIRIGG